MTTKPICPECGKPGEHWVELPWNLWDWLAGIDGFWTCDKFYGEHGRRLTALELEQRDGR